MREAILVHGDDNVVTALVELSGGSVVKVEGTQGVANREIVLQENVAFGHKFAVRQIDQGDAVIKYGETIGIATEPIGTGEWVHTHNIESTRGRGDLNEE